MTHAPRRRSASSPTTSTAAAAWTDARGPTASPRSSASIDADVIALQEVVGAGPNGGGHTEEIGAALGMGWVMAPARQLRGHQFGNVGPQPASHHPSRAARPVVEDVRAARPAARGRRRRRPHAARLQRAPRHGDPRAPASGRSGWRRSCRTGTSPGPKLVLGDFNEWMRGLTTTLLSARLKSVDLRQLPEAAAHLSRAVPDPPPRSHLLRRAAGDHAFSCRAPGCRSSPPITCRWSPTSASSNAATASCHREIAQTKVLRRACICVTLRTPPAHAMDVAGHSATRRRLAK